MGKCTKCGSKIQATAKFCPSCGGLVNGNNITPPNSSQIVKRAGDFAIHGEYSFKGNYTKVVGILRDKLFKDGFTIAGENEIPGGYRFCAKRGSQIKYRLLGQLGSRMNCPINLNIIVHKANQLIQIECCTDIGFYLFDLGVKGQVEPIITEVRDSFHDTINEI